MKVEITCSTGDSLNLSELTRFQGKLKFREKSDIEKVKKSILKYGFSFPFFVWNCGKTNYILDGHGREIALRDLQNEGYEIPELPVVYIQADNEKDAKEKLLRINSRFGDVTNKSFVEFTKGLTFDFSDIDVRFEKELAAIKPVQVTAPVQPKTTIDHFPVFADSTPSEETIKNYESELQTKFANKVEERNEKVVPVTCPCCGKIMMIERNSLLLKIGGGYR